MKTKIQAASEVLTCSSEETFHFGVLLGNQLSCGAVIAFFGDLGAGKTTLIKGIAKGAACIDPREVSSPTFNYLNIYSGSKTIYHFDLYRLNTEKDFLALGFEEYFEAGGICCLEWSEKIASILPKDVLNIYFSHIDENKRKIAVL